MNDSTNPMNVFVAESNVDLVLSKAYQTMDAKQRDTLLRIVVEEETRMARSREHLENGQRRLDDCRQRIRQQRELVAVLRPKGRDLAEAQFLLETFERALMLLQHHQKILAERFHDARL